MTNDIPEERPSVKTMLSGKRFSVRGLNHRGLRKESYREPKRERKPKAAFKEKNRCIGKLLQDVNDTSCSTSLTSKSV